MSELLEYECPNCGGGMTFNIGEQTVKCPYCDSVFTLEQLKALDEGLSANEPDEISWEDKVGTEWEDGEEENIAVYHCNSCGGEIVTETTAAALTCPYCDSPVVMTGKLSGALRPDCVIPFKLEKKEAKTAFEKHLMNKKLLPDAFTENNHIDEIKGIYVPFWIFDGTADGDFKFKATKTRLWSDSKYNYTETSFYQVLRKGNASFSGIPADGSEKMPDDLMESIEPFDMNEARPFQTAFLAGFRADKYDVGVENGQERANARAKRSIEELFRSTVNGYVTVNTEASSVKINNGKAKYGLFPVWMLRTSWNGETYTFAMNGQTGKFVGNLPLDKKKQRKYRILSFLISFAAAMAGCVLVLGVL